MAGGLSTATLGTLVGTFVGLPSDMQCVLEEGKGGPVNSKLICTLGPASRDVDTISKMLVAGMQIARFDLTWGSLDYHQETIDNLRAAMASTNRSCAVAIEVIGKEILVINRPQTAIQMQEGQQVTLTCDKTVASNSSILACSTLTTFEGFGLTQGKTILVGGYLSTGNETTTAHLTVQQISGGTCTCLVRNNCTLDGIQLVVNLAGISMPGPALTQEDEHAIAIWGKRNEVDFVGIPFTTSAKDVKLCREVLQRCGLPHARVIAKVECVEGLKAHQEIVDAADVVVLSRGKLGTRLDPEKGFLAQKLVLRTCNIAGKPVYVTRVVDTMKDSPRPTRAEATDVANLILDGADGIMLGSETFRGKFPELTVQTVSAICRQAEQCFDSHAFYRANMDLYGSELFVNMTKGEALASSAVRAAEKLRAKLMIVFTVTGNTARMISKYKPKQPILTVVCHTASSAEYSEAKLSKNKATMVHSASMESLKNNLAGNAVMRQCLAYRGVIPLMAKPELLDSAELLEYAIQVAKLWGLVVPGDKLVVSQCPRRNKNEVMEEMGVVKMVHVDDVDNKEMVLEEVGIPAGGIS